MITTDHKAKAMEKEKTHTRDLIEMIEITTGRKTEVKKKARTKELLETLDMIVVVTTMSGREILKATSGSTNMTISEAKEDHFANLNIRVTNYAVDHEIYHVKKQVENNVNYSSSRRMAKGFKQSLVETRGDIEIDLVNPRMTK